MTDRTVKVVIAKYNEDTSWLTDLHFKYCLYDKSKNIPNVGREAKTYLRYIIENYDDLPPYVVFPHSEGFDVGSNTRTRELFQAMFRAELPNELEFSAGAQYIVPRENILCRKLSFYTLIRQVMVDKNEEEEKKIELFSLSLDP